MSALLLCNRSLRAAQTNSATDGATENARLELSAPSKMQGWKMQEWKYRNHVTGGGKCGTKQLWKAKHLLVTAHTTWSIYFPAFSSLAFSAPPILTPTYDLLYRKSSHRLLLPGNVYTNFGFSTPFCFRVENPYGRQTQGRTERQSRNAAH